MANPHGTPDVLLTKLSLAKRNNSAGFIAEFGSPSIPVPKTSGTYYKWDDGTFFQNPNNEKAEQTVSRTIFSKATTDTFKTAGYGSREGYTQDELDDFGDAGALKRAKMNAVTDADMISHEKRVADLLTTAGSYASANKKTLTNQWSDASNGDPFGDVTTAKEAVMSGSGVEANAMIMSFLNFNQLKLHPDILSKVQAQNLGSGLADITPKVVGQLFGLDLRISWNQFESSNLGQATKTFAYTWGDFALIFHRTPTPAREIISLSYTFARHNFQMRTYFDTPSKTFFVDNDHKVVSKLIAADVGYLITDVIA